MASAPSYAAYSGIFRFNVTATESHANRDGSGTLATPEWTWTGSTSAPATDWICKRLWLMQSGTDATPGDLADCVVVLYTTNGSVIRPFWDYDLSNPSPGAVGTTSLLLELPCIDWAFPGGVDLRASLTVPPTAGSLVITGTCEKA